jgi:hypothetical protein
MRHTPVYFVCSPRPRVGKTLLARLLTEFLLAQRHAVAAFDINANEPALLDYLPKVTETADVSDTFGQMQLLDRLILHDGIAKVIDLGFPSFDGFFRMLAEIGFAKEAERRMVEPVILFLLDRDSISARAWPMLRQNFPRTAIVPVNNEMVLLGDTPDWVGKTRQLDIGLLPDFLKGYIARTDFSFSAFAQNRANSSSELYDWIRARYLGFREMQLNLILHRM